MQRYWTGRARHYHASQTESERAPEDRQAWLDILTRYLPHQPARILDVGTGSGYLAHRCVELGHEVVGVDNSEGMITIAQRAIPEATFVLGEALNPPVEGPFDVVVCKNVLWTLPDPVAALTAWARLAPQGQIICFDGTWFIGGGNQDTHVDSDDGPNAWVDTYTPELMATLPLANATGPEEFLAALRAAGLDDVRHEELTSIAEIDARYGVSRGHRPASQYAFAGRVST